MKPSSASIWSGFLLSVMVAASTGCNGRETPGSNLSGGVIASNAVIAEALIPPIAAPPLQSSIPTPPVSEPANLAPNLREIAKLANAGVNDSVMLAFIEKSTNLYTLSPDDLIYLSDIGVAPAVITLMQRKGSPNTPTPVVAPGVGGQNSEVPAVSWVTPAPTPPSVQQSGSTFTAPEPTTTVITPNYVPTYTPPPNLAPAPIVVQQPVVVEQPVSVSYFHEALGPYGSWVDVDGYGRCWRPDYARLGSDWRPYADGGRWVWTDSGWYWLSDYPWGWATFHYGRWSHSSPHGWVWIPDTVWAPAWVCWRQNTSHCGWAPLPPGAYYQPASGWWYRDRYVGIDFGFDIGFSFFTFIPWSRFCESHPHHFYASRAHADTLYRDSRVANNTVVGNNNTVVFSGVGLSAVRANSRSPIPQAALRESAWTAAGGVPRERMDQTQGSLVVQSPRLASAPPSKPGAVSGTGGKWAPASSSPSPRTGSTADSGGPSTSTLSPRDASFRAGRTGFEPAAGSGSVFIPATRSGVPQVNPSTPVRSSTIPSATSVPPTADSSVTKGVRFSPSSFTPVVPSPTLGGGAGGKRYSPTAVAHPIDTPSVPGSAVLRPSVSPPTSPPLTLPPRIAGTANANPQPAFRAPSIAITPTPNAPVRSFDPGSANLAPAPVRVYTPPSGSIGGTPASRGFPIPSQPPAFSARQSSPPAYTPPGNGGTPASRGFPVQSQPLAYTPPSVGSAPASRPPAQAAAPPTASHGSSGKKER